MIVRYRVVVPGQGLSRPTWGFLMTPFSAVLILLAAVGQTETARPATAFHTGAQFQTEIDRTLSASWANVELRDLLKKIGDDRRIAILLDRRVDPTVQLPLNLTNSSLREGVRDMARLLGADISVAEPVVFVGPPAAVQRLRTLIELRSSELSSREASIPEKRRMELPRDTPSLGRTWTHRSRSCSASRTVTD